MASEKKVTKQEPSTETAATHEETCVTLPPLEYRKLIWKLDVHLLPPLFVRWFVSLIDRLNIGSAKIFGIEKDLHMDPRGTDFNVVLVTTMVGLILFDVPSNYLLKNMRPSWVLTAENFLLGILTLAQGLATTFTGLAALRFFVGALEAGLIPGSVYLLAQYYPRYELQWRVSTLMVSNALSTASGGLLGLSIAGIRSGNGYGPWRWLFIIEGCVTAGAAVLVSPFLPGWPAAARWLTPLEKQVIADESRASESYLLYSVAIFAPTIINQFEKGQSPQHVQALVIPILASALAACLSAAHASDKPKHRGGRGTAACARYAALFLMAAGVYVSLPMVWTMLVNNVSGAYKVGFAVGLEVGLGNFGGIASALVFQGSQAPGYADGYKTLAVMSCVAAFLVVLYTCLLYRRTGCGMLGGETTGFRATTWITWGMGTFRFGIATSSPG
ncbi:hypothetical protein KVR01_002999 [Diaporthe batatas]|uniref:uncharacterized protein n=1 Tax=Diaporthe batatas TaxID=748121 RepID=UPI001D05756B|nr:uncharacterized protein KVR01_002999 [Diaporthe batatas]KAG8167310.1 hypothetical protein KVR01_002999 [Diaporthe batatas]